MISILHTADIHLRDTQFGSPQRGREFTEAFMQVIDRGMARGVTAILAAGDILNCKRPSSRNVSDLLDINKRLKESNITMYCVPGDHDWSEPTWTSIIADDDDPRIIDITNKLVTISNEKESITVFGAPSPCMHPKFFRAAADNWPRADVFLYHGPFKEFAAYPMGDEAATVEDIPLAKYQAVLLGDLHSHQYRYFASNAHGGPGVRSSKAAPIYPATLVGYPGPTEYCSGNERALRKSVTILHFEGGKLLPYTKEQSTVYLSNRTVVRREIHTEDEFASLLGALEKIRGKKPIVYVWHAREVTNVFSRIAQVLDPRECIIRVDLLPDAGEGGTILEQQIEETMDRKKLADFLHEFIPMDSPVYDLARVLCDKSTKPGPVIDLYVDRRMRDMDLTDKF
jgi:hypothetical protein